YRGIHIRQGATGITITGNKFINTHTGLGIVSATPAVSGITMTENDLSGVQLGVNNGSANNVVATYNYWGTCPSVSGPATYFPYWSAVSGTPGSFIFSGSIANINAEATVPTVCAGSSTTIFATGGSDYLWDNGLGLGSSKVVSPSVNTTYNVTGKDANGCTGAFDDVIIGVNAAPTVTITGPTSANAGSLVTLTAGGASTYVWNTGETTTAISVYPTSTTTYSVTGTALGCSGSATHTVTPVSVTAGPNRFVCSGSQTTLTAIVVGATPVSYLWAPGGQTTASIDITPNTTTVYTVTATVTGGATPQAQVTVFVNSKPIANAGSDLTVVPGGSGTLTGSASAGIAPYTYTWTIVSGGPIVSGANTATPVVKAGTYSLVVGDAFGCTSVADNAVVTEASGGFTVSGNVSYYNNLNPQMHNVTITLDQGGAPLYTAVTPATGNGDYTILGVPNGTYNVKFSLPTAWGGVTSADIIAIQNHYKSPGGTLLHGIKRLAADVIANSTAATVLSNDRDQVNAKRLNPNGVSFATGNWVFVKSGDELSDPTTFVYANSAGTTNIQITVSGATVTQNFKSLCYGDVDASYSGYKEDEQIVSMNASNGLGLINFPNPFSKMTTIRYNVPVESKVVIKVHDLLGNQIATINDPDTYEGSHNIFFDAAGLAPGVYLYSVTLNTGDDQLVQTGKMVINR
ncbi:MAG: T9SS type A sorting domain-containing protein, partial [Bacteroidales bacterium]